MSPQYLSEIERGTKDPSSEMLEAVTEALGLPLDDLLREAAGQVTLPSPSTIGTSAIDPISLAA